MALLGEQPVGGTQAADSRFFMPGERASNPFPDAIADAQAELNQIFTNDDAGKEADARYRRGLQDVLAHRDTPDAAFYVHAESLASVANHAYDRPR